MCIQEVLPSEKGQIMYCLMAFLTGQVVGAIGAGENTTDEVIKVPCLQSDGDVTELCRIIYAHIHKYK